MNNRYDLRPKPLSSAFLQRRVWFSNKVNKITTDFRNSVHDEEELDNLIIAYKFYLRNIYLLTDYRVKDDRLARDGSLNRTFVRRTIRSSLFNSIEIVKMRLGKHNKNILDKLNKLDDLIEEVTRKLIKFEPL